MTGYYRGGETMARVVMSFTLDSQTDRRILHYLEGLPRGEKSKAIRDALHAHLGGGSVTLRDVLQAVNDLENRLGSCFVSAQAGNLGGASQTPVDEPADVAANLDGLGL
jgi:hypothetical protein